MSRIDIAKSEAREILRRVALYGTSSGVSYQQELKDALSALVREVDDALIIANESGYERGYNEGYKDGKGKDFSGF